MPILIVSPVTPGTWAGAGELWTATDTSTSRESLESRRAMSMFAPPVLALDIVVQARGL